MKLLNFTIIKLTLCLVIGIIIGFSFTFSLIEITTALCVTIIGLSTSYYYLKSRYKDSSVFGCFAFAAVLCIGVLSTITTDETLQSSHYKNSDINLNNYNEFSFKVEKRLKPDLYNTKYIVRITTLNTIKASGLILLNIKKDSTSYELNIGASYATKHKFVAIQKPKNPFQFNYNKYLKERQVHHQVYSIQTELLAIKSNSKTLSSFADNFRKIINSKLIKAGFRPDALSIINALLLGQRQDISPEIYNNYVNAGTIHILAVSGLHVGIVFLILGFLLQPLHRFKYGKHFIKPTIIVLFLWGFAIVAGLSPSVTRAVSMFSIIAIAQHLKRPTNIYNTITISAFIILLINPIFIFDVGFQMSYLAVLAIVSIQPLLYKLWQPKNYLVDKPWQIFTVTLAAQLGVAPISLFYFHQFPGLFFVSNLVIIPFLGLILGFGLLVIFLALIDKLPNFLVESFGFVIDCLNSFIAWIAQFEDFLFRDISFSIYHALASYLIIIAIIKLWKNRSVYNIKLSLFSVFIFSAVLVYTKYNTTKSEFVVFNKSRKTVLGKKINRQLTVNHNLNNFNFDEEQILKNYKVGHFINYIETDSIYSVYNLNNELLLVIDSSSAYNVKEFKSDYILLRNSPKLNLNRLIDSLNPKLIIADASNYKSYVQRWKATCEHKKIPFHSTYEKGAFILK
jgi:competence protein ComEC